jgi:hypothetical protein
MRKFCLAAVVVVALSLGGSASGSMGAAPLWSGPIDVAPTGGGVGLSSVSCPTTAQCTAVSGPEALTFDPQNPASVQRLVLQPTGLQSVDCFSATQCTGVAGDSEMTFDPTTGTIEEVAKVAPITNLVSVSCPTVTLCAAAGTREVAFNPLTGEVTRAGVTSYLNHVLAAIDCVSAQQCTAVSLGFEWTFDPVTGQLNAAGVGRLGGSSSNFTSTSVSCPTGTVCVVIDNQGDELPFNPITADPVGAGLKGGLIGWSYWKSVSCVSASACTAVTRGGGEATFNPQTGTVNAPGGTSLVAEDLLSVACLPGSSCIAVGSTGDEVTFDPAAPSSAVVTPLATSLALTALSCPSEAQCTALGGAKEATFNPQTGSVLSYNDAALHGTGRNFDRVACSSTNQCTALLSFAGGGPDTVTFGPPTGAANAAGLLKRLSGTAPPSGIACPSATQCTVIDFAGFETTFDPTTGTVNAAGTLRRYPDIYLIALACPSVTQCTGLYPTNKEVTFNPTDGSFATAPTTDISGGQYSPFVAISCPTTTQCTAIGSQDEITFDPTTGQPNAAGSYLVDPGHAMTSVSCPTVAECIGVDRNGRAVAFDTTQPWLQTISTLPDASALLGVDCASANECVAVDGLGQAYATDNARHTVLTNGPHDPTAYSTTATFSFASDDNSATFECSLDGSAWQACPSPTTYTGLSAGTHTFLVRAVDGTVVDGSPASETWTIPMPEAQITSGPKNPMYSPSATFSFSSSDGNAAFQCNLDNAGWQACSSPTSYTNLSVGTHTFQVRATEGTLVQPTPASQTWAIKLGETDKLTVTVYGSGNVTTAPSGISCPTTCAHLFRNGLVVTLTAKASLGSTFVGWSGGGCTGTASCQLTIAAATIVKATFATRKLLTVLKGGTGAGTVTSSPTGIACGSTCTHKFDHGTVVTLTATPKAGSTFTGWSSACTGTGSCVVTMSAARTVKALFALH